MTKLSTRDQNAVTRDPLLNLESLRSTAIRLQLDAGKSIAEMQVFLDSQVAAKQTRFNRRPRL